MIEYIVPSPLSPFENGTIGSLMLIFGITGLLSNIHLLAINYTRNKGDVLTNHLLIANCLLCFIYPFPIYSSFRNKWAFSDNLCQFYGFAGLFFGYAIMGSIALIVVDEYLMFNSRSYSAKRTKLNRLMIIFIWLNSLFWSLCPLFGWSRIAVELHGTACTVIYFPNDGYTSYILTVFIFCYVLPITFLLYAKRKYDDYKKVDMSVDENASKLSKGTLMLFLNFVVCWTPYTIVYLWPILFTSKVNVHLAAWSPLIVKTTPLMTAFIFKYESSYNFK